MARCNISSLLLLLISAVFFPSHSIAAPSPVYDETGAVVVPGKPYYILPAYDDGAGGLTAVPKSPGSGCPLYVAQAQQGSNGQPVVFSGSGAAVLTSTDTTITFQGVSVCVSSMQWRLAAPVNGEQFVVASGTPAPARFQLVDVGSSPAALHSYKFVHCTGSSQCTDVGIMSPTGATPFYLALPGEVTLSVVFAKASA